MLDVLSITGVVFILIGAGYLSVLASVFSGAELATLGKFVLNFALPALILHAMTSRPIGEVISAPYMGAFLFGSVGAFLAGFILARRGMDAQPVEATFDGMGMSCANSGFVGYPILLMAMPAIAPTVLALIAGLLVSLTGRQLPHLISAPVEIVARSSAALSLFVIGGTLAGLPLRRFGTRVPVVVAGKLILHPILAGRYGQQDVAAVAMLLMTVLSFVTISAILWLLDAIPVG